MYIMFKQTNSNDTVVRINDIYMVQTENPNSFRITIHPSGDTSKPIGFTAQGTVEEFFKGMMEIYYDRPVTPCKASVPATVSDAVETTKRKLKRV